MNIFNIKIISLFPRILFKRHKSIFDYQLKRRECKKCNLIQQGVIKNQKEIDIEAFCFYCNKKTKMKIDFQYGWKTDNGKIIPNLRERLECEQCHLNSRMRATLHMLSFLCGDLTKKKIYITEELTPLFNLLKKEYNTVVGSEFIPDKEKGALIRIDENKTINNQDLTKLTYSNNEFDLILSLDVFEHIFDYRKALSEIFRVLKSDSYFVFSVPFSLNSKNNIMRAKIKNNIIINILPPEYHGDPVTKNGCLCFYHFGWEIFNDLKDIGFKDSGAYTYQSLDFGYLSEGIIFYAKK